MVAMGTALSLNISRMIASRIFESKNGENISPTEWPPDGGRGHYNGRKGKVWRLFQSPQDMEGLDQVKILNGLDSKIGRYVGRKFRRDLIIRGLSCLVSHTPLVTQVYLLLARQCAATFAACDRTA
jgi:hypothetical protein